MSAAVTIRHDLRPGDAAIVVALHQSLYSREFGFDDSFLDHVSEPVNRFQTTASPRERLWIAELESKPVGCIAIVEQEPAVGRVRWFLLDPQVRGQGIGKRLIVDAIAFCKAHGYSSIILWTISTLTTAAHVYRSAGFVKVIEQPGVMGGTPVTEEMYELRLSASEEQA